MNGYSHYSRSTSQDRKSTASDQQQHQHAAQCSNYFNNFANYDNIGFENDFPHVHQSESQTQYNYDFQNPQYLPDPVKTAQPAGIGSIGVDDGCINIKLPVAYSYNYDYIKPRRKKKTFPMKARDDNEKCQVQESASNPRTRKPEDQKSFKQTSASSKPRKFKEQTDPPLFCSTVKNLRGPPRKGNFPRSNYPEFESWAHGDPPTGKVKTSMKWDVDRGFKIPVKKVDYGEELYERAVQNLTRKLAEEKSPASKYSSKSTSSKASDAMRDEKCRDFSKPGFNSSLKVTDELAKALEQLKKLPQEMERIFMTDHRFEPIVLEKATKVLNVPRESTLFKNLVSVESNEDAREKVTKSITDQIKSVRPETRSRDPTPNLLDYQEITWSRIKPQPIAPPPKPQSGVSVDITSHTQHQMVNSQRTFEDEADRI